MNKNYGLKLEPRETDYVMGDGHINLKGMPLFPSGSSLLDFSFFESQLVLGGDTNGCVIFTGEQIINCLWEAWSQIGVISKETNDWVESLGFMDIGSDGQKHFHASERFLQINTGNGLNGNNIYDVFDAARKYGLIPAKMLPVDKSLTPQQYIDPSAITQQMKNVGIQFLAGVGGKDFLTYHWVNNGTANVSTRIASLPYGPLAIGVDVGTNWNVVNPPAPTNGANPGHCVALFAETYTNGTDEADIFDHYQPNPKHLINWDVRYALQAFLVVTPPPPAPVPPVQTPNETPAQINQGISQWLSQLVVWLSHIMERITPTGRAKLGGASRSPHWESFKKEFALTHLPICAVCGSVKQLNLHHLRPFHVFPELELDPENVVWLCNEKECHIRIGHLGNFQSINPGGAEDIKTWHDKIASRPMTAEDIKKDLSTIENK